jgi:hypothetical protein
MVLRGFSLEDVAVARWFERIRLVKTLSENNIVVTAENTIRVNV